MIAKKKDKLGESDFDFRLINQIEIEKDFEILGVTAMEDLL